MSRARPPAQAPSDRPVLSSSTPAREASEGPSCFILLQLQTDRMGLMFFTSSSTMTHRQGRCPFCPIRPMCDSPLGEASERALLLLFRCPVLARNHGANAILAEMLVPVKYAFVSFKALGPLSPCVSSSLSRRCRTASERTVDSQIFTVPTARRQSAPSGSWISVPFDTRQSRYDGS